MCVHVLTALTRDEGSLDMEHLCNHLHECVMAKKADTAIEHFPTGPKVMRKAQKKDESFLRDLKTSKRDCTTIAVEGTELPSFQGKTAVPCHPHGRMVAWHHKHLVHPGAERLHKTINQTLWWPDLCTDCRKWVKSCHKCQLTKKTGRKKHGKLPPKKAKELVPWNRVDLDCIGPLSVTTTSVKECQLKASTMIDPATGCLEMVDLPEIDSKSCVDAFDDVWLSRCPRPQHLGCNNGKKFKKTFEDMRTTHEMDPHRTATENPQPMESQNECMECSMIACGRLNWMRENSIPINHGGSSCRPRYLQLEAPITLRWKQHQLNSCSMGTCFCQSSSQQIRQSFD